MSIMRSILCLTPSSLAFVLGGAHFWRAGQYPFSVGCMLFALLVWRREAWIRQVTLVLLPLLAARWVWAAAQFVQIRMFMEQPWMRLACILLGVSLFTATAALLLEGKTGDAWYARGRKRALMRTAAFFGTIAILTPLLFVAPQVFLTERFLPGWAPLHILLAGFGPRGWHRGLGTGMPRRVRAYSSGACSRWPFSYSSPSVLPDTACSL